MIFHFFKKLAIFDIRYTKPKYVVAPIVKFPFSIAASAKKIISPRNNFTRKIYFSSYTAFEYINQ